MWGMTDQSNSPNALVCTRAIARQGTSHRAFRGEPLEPGDPLLGFRPVPHKAPRRNSIGPARQRAFVAALAASGIVTQAARAIGASVEALYRLRNRPGAEEFRAAWDAAIDRAVARLEDTALARAIAGEERMVVSRGQVLGTEMRHNENLVMFFLRNRRPERYGNSVREQDLKPGHPAYERIRKEVLAEDAQSEEETRASIVRFLEDMRERRLANEKVLADFAAEDEAKRVDEAKAARETETSPEPPVIEAETDDDRPKP
jgi:hypothetical protein